MLEEQLVEAGLFESTEYLMVTDFFEELTGDIHSLFDWGKNHYEYENYFYRYERLISEFILGFAPKKFINHLPATLHHDFWKHMGKN